MRGAQPFYGVFWGSTTRSQCRVAFELLPETGRDYEVTFHWNLYETSCAMTVSDVEAGSVRASRNIEMPLTRCQSVLTRSYLY